MLSSMRRFAVGSLLVIASCSIDGLAGPVSRTSDNMKARTLSSNTSEYAWTSLPHIGVGPRQEHSVVALNQAIYVIGGLAYNDEREIQTLDRVEFYNTTTQTWHVAGPLPQPMNHANAAVVGDKIYVLGALNGGMYWAAVPDCYVYYSQNDTWAQISWMTNTTTRGSSAVGVYGSKIYLAGGMTILEPTQIGFQDCLDVVTAFDVDTMSWEYNLPALPQPRQHVGGAVVGSTFYVIGGRENGVEQYHNTTYALDLENPVGWKEMAAMPTARGSLTCSAVGVKIFCFGGEGNPANWQKIFNQTQAYDTVTDSWETLQPMAVPRHGFGSATVGDKVYIPGGAPTTAGPPVGIMDSFGLVTRSS